MHSGDSGAKWNDGNDTFSFLFVRIVDPSVPLVCYFCSQQAGSSSLEGTGGDGCPSRLSLEINTCTLHYIVA